MEYLYSQLKSKKMINLQRKNSSEYKKCKAKQHVFRKTVSCNPEYNVYYTLCENFHLISITCHKRNHLTSNNNY
ncbi:MAG: hypothetical protein XD95_0209 [Microgenomates bacterium 39_7]|nr:MAG: hypothetical protein XD95_0209 [Microgenomates bacterium 39_7]